MSELEVLTAEIREVKGLLRRLVGEGTPGTASFLGGTPGTASFLGGTPGTASFLEGTAGMPSLLGARELAVRWGIGGGSDYLRLQYLSRRCRAWGLRPMEGTRGWSAMYRLADVLAAEEFGAGIAKRRRRAK